MLIIAFFICLIFNFITIWYISIPSAKQEGDSLAYGFLIAGASFLAIYPIYSENIHARYIFYIYTVVLIIYAMYEYVSRRLNLYEIKFNSDRKQYQIRHYKRHLDYVDTPEEAEKIVKEHYNNVIKQRESRRYEAESIKKRISEYNKSFDEKAVANLRTVSNDIDFINSKLR